jgi:hypothetical protein
MDFATLLRTLFSRGNSLVLKFLFIVLGCWDVGLAKRVIPFSRSGVFVFRETVLTRPASNPEFFICFTEWRIEERRFPFLSGSSLCFQLSFLLSSAFFTIVAYWKKTEEQERIRAVGKKGWEMETAHYAIMLMNTLDLPLSHIST